MWERILSGRHQTRKRTHESASKAHFISNSNLKGAGRRRHINKYFILHTISRRDIRSLHSSRHQKHHEPVQKNIFSSNKIAYVRGHTHAHKTHHPSRNRCLRTMCLRFLTTLSEDVLTHPRENICFDREYIAAPFFFRTTYSYLYWRVRKLLTGRYTEMFMGFYTIYFVYWFCITFFELKNNGQ